MGHWFENTFERTCLQIVLMQQTEPLFRLLLVYVFVSLLQFALFFSNFLNVTFWMPEKSVEQDVWYLVYFEMKYHSMIDILKIVQKSQSALQETKLFYIIISHMK